MHSHIHSTCSCVFARFFSPRFCERFGAIAIAGFHSDCQSLHRTVVERREAAGNGFGSAPADLFAFFPQSNHVWIGSSNHLCYSECSNSISLFLFLSFSHPIHFCFSFMFISPFDFHWLHMKKKCGFLRRGITGRLL